MSGLPNSCPRVADASVATREPRNRIPSARPQAGHCPSRPACASGVTRTANWLPCRLVGGGTTSAVSGSTQTTSVEPCAASPGANIHARDTDRSIADLLHIEVGAVPVLPPAVATTPQPDRPQCRQNTEGRNLVPSSTVAPEHGGAGQPSQEPAHFSDPQLHVDSEQRGAIARALESRARYNATALRPAAVRSSSVAAQVGSASCAKWLSERGASVSRSKEWVSG